MLAHIAEYDSPGFVDVGIFGCQLAKDFVGLIVLAGSEEEEAFVSPGGAGCRVTEFVVFQALYIDIDEPLVEAGSCVIELVDDVLEVADC